MDLEHRELREWTRYERERDAWNLPASQIFSFDSRLVSGRTRRSLPTWAVTRSASRSRRPERAATTRLRGSRLARRSF